MKIVHVAQFLGIGGLEKILFLLSKEQIEAGHDVEVIVYDYEQSWVPYFQQNGIRVKNNYNKKKHYDFGLIFYLLKNIRHADIVHTHDLNPLMYLGPVSLIKKIFCHKKFKLIHTTHGIDHVRSFKISLYEKVFIPLTDVVVAVSDKIGQFYKTKININPARLQIIPNGIKTFSLEINTEMRNEKKRWLCQKHLLDFNRPVVLSLSRVVPLKDQKFLINCFKQRPHYQLIIAGPAGNISYYEDLKKLEDDNIKLIGAQDMVTDYNLGADLYVSASTSEGIPVAVLEAMAVETPCLVSNIPGHQILNYHGAFVDLFQLGDLSDFLEKCDHLLNENNEIKEATAKSRTTVEEFFSVKNMVKKYFEIYQA